MQHKQIPQCECQGRENGHRDSIEISWSVETKYKIPLRCAGNDIDPYPGMPEMASLSIVWTQRPPVRGYTYDLRSLSDGLWILGIGEWDQPSEVFAIRGTRAEALDEWLTAAESVAPGTRRFVAALVTGSLDGVPANQEGGLPQHLFDGHAPNTDPTLKVLVRPDGRDALSRAVAQEISWVTSPDTSAGSWQSRLQWWQAEEDSHEPRLPEGL